MKWLIALLYVLSSTWTIASAADSEADKTALVGTYTIVEGERNGVKIPADHLHDVSVQIAENAITTFDKDKKRVYAASYQFISARSPWKIMMQATLSPDKSDGAKAAGLIELSGDKVRLIYALPGGDSPTEFKTGNKQQMFVLQRQALSP